MEFFVQVGCRFAGAQPSFESNGFRGFARAAKVSEALLEALLSGFDICGRASEVRLRNTALGRRFIESGPTIVIQSRDPISLFFEGESEVQSCLQFLWGDGERFFVLGDGGIAVTGALKGLAAEVVTSRTGWIELLGAL